MNVFRRCTLVVGVLLVACWCSNGSPLKHKAHGHTGRHHKGHGKDSTKKDSVRQPTVLAAVMNPGKLDVMEEKELSQLQDFNKEFINNEMAAETSLLANQGIDDDSALRISNMAALPNAVLPGAGAASKAKIGDMTTDQGTHPNTPSVPYNPDEYMFDANSWPEYKIRDSDYTSNNFRVSSDGGGPPYMANGNGLGTGMEGPFGDGTPPQMMNDQPQDSPQAGFANVPAHQVNQGAMASEEGNSSNVAAQANKGQQSNNKDETAQSNKEPKELPSMNKGESAQFSEEPKELPSMSKEESAEELPSMNKEEPAKSNKEPSVNKDKPKVNGNKTTENAKEVQIKGKEAKEKVKDKAVVTLGSVGIQGQLLFPPAANNRKPAVVPGEVSGNTNDVASERLKEVLLNKGSNQHAKSDGSESKVGEALGSDKVVNEGSQQGAPSMQIGQAEGPSSSSSEAKPDETSLPVENSPALQPKPQSPKESGNSQAQEGPVPSKGDSSSKVAAPSSLTSSSSAADIANALANAQGNSPLGKFAEFLKSKGISLTVNKDSQASSSAKTPDKSSGETTGASQEEPTIQSAGPSMSSSDPSAMQTQGSEPNTSDGQSNQENGGESMSFDMSQSMQPISEGVMKYQNNQPHLQGNQQDAIFLRKKTQPEKYHN